MHDGSDTVCILSEIQGELMPPREELTKNWTNRWQEGALKCDLSARQLILVEHARDLLNV